MRCLGSESLIGISRRSIGEIMSQPADHVEDPFGAEFQKGNLQRRETVEDAVTDKRDKSQLRRQAHTDAVGFQKILTDSVRKACSSCPCEPQRRQSGRRKFFPNRQKRRNATKATPYRSENHRGAGAERLHLVDRFGRFARGSRMGSNPPHFNRLGLNAH